MRTVAIHPPLRGVGGIRAYVVFVQTDDIPRVGDMLDMSYGLVEVAKVTWSFHEILSDRVDLGTGVTIETKEPTS